GAHTLPPHFGRHHQDELGRTYLVVDEQTRHPTRDRITGAHVIDGEPRLVGCATQLVLQPLGPGLRTLRHLPPVPQYGAWLAPPPCARASSARSAPRATPSARAHRTGGFISLIKLLHRPPPFPYPLPESFSVPYMAPMRGSVGTHRPSPNCASPRFDRRLFVGPQQQPVQNPTPGDQLLGEFLGHPVRDLENTQ